MSDIPQTPKKRIEYIDALRGFTMILVVFFHVSMLSFDSDSSFLNKLFLSFRMPLFFWVSGFIGYKANVSWDKHTWWTMSSKKVLVQLFPTLIFGLIYAYAYRHVGVKDFVMDNLKLGYWFTIVLLEIFLIIYTSNFLLYSSNSRVFKKRQLVSIVILACLLYCFSFISKGIPALEEFCNIFSFHKLFKYFPYFAFGYICSMSKEKFHGMLENNKYLMSVVIVLFCILFYLNNFVIYPQYNVSIVFSSLYFLCRTIIGFFGLLVVYNTFRVYQDSFTADKKVGKALQYIGKRTLDIYLLHWFFFPVLPQLGNVLSEGKNMALELVLGGGLSLIIVGICLVVSSVLRTSSILAKYLFGARK